MARIRSIKPEFWTSEQVMELSRDARLAFIGLWNFCDDAGIHPASPKRLKAEVFPADDLTSEDVRRLVDELLNLELVNEYEVDGQTFWIVTGWHHQKIEKPTFQHPRPDGTVPDGAAKRRQTRMASSNSTTDRGGLADDSSNDRGGLADSSPPESSRVESSRVDKTIGTNTGNARTPRAGSNDSLTPPEISVSLIGWERDRKKQARGISASTPQVVELAEMHVTAEELRRAYDAAVADRQATSDLTPINAGFIRMFVEKHRNPPKARPKAEIWWLTNETMSAKARELGIAPARPGEEPGAFKARIQQALNTKEAA